jgi:hypothetical protein
MRRTGIRRMIAVILALWFSVMAVHHENVVLDIRCKQPSFVHVLLAAVYGVITLKNINGLRRTFSVFSIYALTLLSMLSYDGMIASPVIIWVLMLRYATGYADS